jgi:undecaprenyl-diphosphatase
MLDVLLGWDERIFRLLNGKWFDPALDRLLPFVTGAGNSILPFVVAAIIIVWVGRMRGLRFLILAVVSVVVADAIGTHLFKYSFLRARPCIGLADVRLLVGCTNLPSFPSNHAVNASVLATLTTLYMPRLWLPATALALLVGYTRVYVGVHYPLDVLAGSVLGIVVALALSGIMNFLWPLTSEPAERPRSFSLKMKIGES